MQAIITAMVERPGRFVGSLVEARRLGSTRERWELPALLALLLIAAIVRFWGVGSYSLHKPDEDTTALPAVHILQDGTPRFPSGMFYARAIVQSYLIAGAVKVFGQTEWALRLPSVLTGILLVLLAFFLGKRFLDPPWNMAFIAAVALLPGMIADSQEVRMYIFLSASLASYLIFLFRWERTGNTLSLATAVAAFLIATQFQEIAIFSSALFLFPGLAHGDDRKLRQGLFAFIAAVAAYLAISRWIGSFYPPRLHDALPMVSQTGRGPTAGMLRFELLVLVPALAVSVGLVWFLVRTMASRGMAMIAGTLLYLGLASQALLLYHFAALFIISGLIVSRRHKGAPGFALWLLAAASLTLAALHFALLHEANSGSARKIIGVMVGQPSIWPYLQVAAYSPVAMLMVVAALGVDLWRVASGGRIRDDVLFAILGVFVPLFGIGFFGWYIPPRYGEFALLPMLLCALAAAQRFAFWSSDGRRLGIAIPVSCLAALACIAVVNPWAVARSVNAGSSFADHRGAARYMRSLKLQRHDVVVAEEVLMQTYYLGHVDYWLTGPSNAADYLVRVNGQLVDEYTHTPVIYSESAFDDLLAAPDRGAIYVIGSGENDGRDYLRGPEISRLLSSPAFKTVYVGADGETKVWKIDAPGVAAARPD